VNRYNQYGISVAVAYVQPNYLKIYKKKVHSDLNEVWCSAPTVADYIRIKNEVANIGGTQVL
jgi:hypothetical protein